MYGKLFHVSCFTKRTYRKLTLEHELFITYVARVYSLIANHSVVWKFLAKAPALVKVDRVTICSHTGVVHTLGMFCLVTFNH
jgi:hypothetical protein